MLQQTELLRNSCSINGISANLEYKLQKFLADNRKIFLNKLFDARSRIRVAVPQQNVCYFCMLKFCGYTDTHVLLHVIIKRTKHPGGNASGQYIGGDITSHHRTSGNYRAISNCYAF